MPATKWGLKFKHTIVSGLNVNSLRATQQTRINACILVEVQVLRTIKWPYASSNFG